MGQLCDNDCEITLTKKDLLAKKNDQIILKGYRNNTDGLWDIPIPVNKSNKSSSHLPKHVQPNPTLLPTHAPINPTQGTSIWHPQNVSSSIPIPKSNTLNVIIRKRQSKQNLARYLHVACFSPCPSTFIKAIKNGNFIGWPGLSSSLISNMNPVPATSKGHLNQERQWLQSTRKENPFLSLTSESEDHQDAFPISDNPNTKTYECFSAINKFDPKELAYADLTGDSRFNRAVATNICT